jgi:hypothetical protein
LGVVRGTSVERLYREIRALRIYEGASEVLKLVIASKVLEEMASQSDVKSSRARPASRNPAEGPGTER